MIIDLRTYTYLPSGYRRFLKSYGEIGFPLTSRHLGRTLGVFRPESGVQNRTFQFFMYRDSAHRDACRRGMLGDPAWAAFVKIDIDALLQQMNTILVPTDFSPLGGDGAIDPVPAASATPRLFELRSWTCRADSVGDVLARLGGGDAAILSRHVPEVIGWFTADTGVDHRLFRLAAFADAADRDAARAAAAADAEVAACRRTLLAATIAEEAQLLVPMPYSPLR